MPKKKKIVPPIGPPQNLRPGGIHQDKRDKERHAFKIKLRKLDYKEIIIEEDY